MNKLGNKLPESSNHAPTKISLDFDKAFHEINLIAIDLCPYCGGSKITSDAINGCIGW